MIKKYSNPCIRCGTERIVLKTWKEKVGSSIIINTQKVCPNPECQKKVDIEKKKQQDKHIAMKLKSEQRASNRKAIKDAERVIKKRSQKK